MPVPSGVPFQTHYDWMAFIDGENLTMRAQRVADGPLVALVEGEYHKRDCFVWLPNVPATSRIGEGPKSLSPRGSRAYYYTSLVGDQPAVDAVRESLWKLGFSPQVFKRDANQKKAKGVDIALTKDMLTHAYQGHYEVAVLVAGDGDYVPVVEQVKRFGRLVYVWFFENEGLNNELRLASDYFFDLTGTFMANWGEPGTKR